MRDDVHDHSPLATQKNFAPEIPRSRHYSVDSMNNGQPQPVPDETASASDGVLVRRFANCRDEAAFAELVARYRGLVFGVCGRVLQHRQDVEDAFQAAFLVLARDAAEIRSRDSIAAWLYGVAHRIALHARARKSRRRETTLKETEAMGLPNPFAELAQRSELQALDEELNLLPEKYREPLVLHYLLNRTAPQIAEELKLTQTAVEGRLKRGRDKLRKQLARRGIGLTAILPVLVLCQSSAEASLGSTLVDQTVQAGLSFTSAGHSHPLYSHEAANLAAKEIGTMTTTSAGTFTAVALSATAIIGLAVGIAGQVPAPGRDGTQDGGEIALGQHASQPDPATAIPAIHVGAVSAQRPRGAGAGAAGIGGEEGGLARGAGPAAKPPAKPAGVDDVLRRRLQILEQIAKVSRTRMRVGGGDVSLLLKAELKAEIDVLDAKLELARTPAERVAIRKDIVKHLRDLEAALKRVSAVGGVRAISPEEALRAEAARLQAEADLLREQAGLNRKRGVQMNMSSGGGIGAPGMGSMMAGVSPRGGTTFDLKSRPATELKILTELEKTTKVDFDIGVSLKDAFADIAENHGITIIPDKTPLDQAQIKLDELQTRFTLSGLTLSSVMKIILKEHGLDYVLKNEVLQITTVEAANKYHETRVYDVSNLNADAEALSTIITDNLGVWKDEGDPTGGTISAAKSVLVVKQSQRVHEEIVDLLQQLGRVPSLEIRGRFLGGKRSKSKPSAPKSKPAAPRGGFGGGIGGFGGGGAGVLVLPPGAVGGRGVGGGGGYIPGSRRTKTRR
jgi:RNA polymerase sigma factor (sigma-70 family)